MEVPFKKFLGNNQHAVCAPLLLISSLSPGPLTSWRSFPHHRGKDGLPNCLLFAWMVLILPDSRDAECSKSFWQSFPTWLLTTFSSSVKAPRSPPLPFLIFRIGISGFGRHLCRSSGYCLLGQRIGQRRTNRSRRDHLLEKGLLLREEAVCGRA